MLLRSERFELVDELAVEGVAGDRWVVMARCLLEVVVARPESGPVLDGQLVATKFVGQRLLGVGRRGEQFVASYCSSRASKYSSRSPSASASKGAGAAGWRAARAARARAAMAATPVAAAAAEAAANGLVPRIWSTRAAGGTGTVTRGRPSAAAARVAALGAGRGAGGTVVGAAAVGVIAEVAMRRSQPASAGAAGAPQIEAPGCAAATAVRAASCASIVACIASKRCAFRSSALS